MKNPIMSLGIVAILVITLMTSGCLGLFEDDNGNGEIEEPPLDEWDYENEDVTYIDGFGFPFSDNHNNFMINEIPEIPSVLNLGIKDDGFANVVLFDNLEYPGFARGVESEENIIESFDSATTIIFGKIGDIGIVATKSGYERGLLDGENYGEYLLANQGWNVETFNNLGEEAEFSVNIDDGRYTVRGDNATYSDNIDGHAQEEIDRGEDSDRGAVTRHILFKFFAAQALNGEEYNRFDLRDEDVIEYLIEDINGNNEELELRGYPAPGQGANPEDWQNYTGRDKIYMFVKMLVYRYGRPFTPVDDDPPVADIAVTSGYVTDFNLAY